MAWRRCSSRANCCVGDGEEAYHRAQRRARTQPCVYQHLTKELQRKHLTTSTTDNIIIIVIINNYNNNDNDNNNKNHHHHHHHNNNNNENGPGHEQPDCSWRLPPLAVVS